jgi:UDP-N-acetylmuramyl pentapeptide phosphotransferase/UDP-N-acetylglucosamine-1-phosphate transferase
VTLAYSPNAAALVTFAVAGLLTAVLVPLVRGFGLRWGLVDTPDSRKQHSTPMVRLGGIGIVAGFSLALTITWLAGGFAELPAAKDRLIWTTLAGCLCFFVIGLADDLFALPPLPRLVAQVAVAMAVWDQGVRIGSIELPLEALGGAHLGCASVRRGPGSFEKTTDARRTGRLDDDEVVRGLAQGDDVAEVLGDLRACPAGGE